jgi:hypothetical protein
MKHSIFSLTVVGVIAVTVALLLSSCTDRSFPVQQEPEYNFNYVRGAARFWADYDMVFLPDKVSGLYFDTTYSYMTIHRAPKWQFIGRLKVDSLIRDDVVEAIVNENQLAGVIIAPQALRDCLAEHKVFFLGPRFPRVVPYDTLQWGDIRQWWWTLLDPNMHFAIFFSKGRSILQTLDCLNRVGGLADLGPFEVPTPWIPYEKARPTTSP